MPRQVVRAAVAQDWTALAHASPRMKESHAVMTEVVRQAWEQLALASDSVKNNEEVVLVAGIA
ncbi:hypothetical protein T484DRAFT_1807397 [Baffinella frigidus]|nr:hypothetical protein T484DRAFT_1807397 [Cryptophyta sp. CCMP2293]